MPVTAAVRRSVAVALGAAFLVAPPASADEPNCTAADIAGVAAGVSAATAAYLFTHPDVNEFATGLKGRPRDQVLADVQAYLDANPRTRDEIRAVRQPLADVRARCGIGTPDGALPGGALPGVALPS
ncbi:MAG: hemophore-related protein [Mycobacterium sp.]